MTTLLLATRNGHKTREFAAILGGDFAVRDLNDTAELPVVAETGATFEENTKLKALTASRAMPKEWVIADDSGLEVDALGGAPGIYSARYAGESASAEANIAKLLRELHAVRKRTARFVCVLALARGGEIVTTFRRVTAGAIAREPHGAGGFGYDPVFVPEGFSDTFAELPRKVKNEISHRGRAVRELRRWLATRLAARPRD